MSAPPRTVGADGQLSARLTWPTDPERVGREERAVKGGRSGSSADEWRHPDEDRSVTLWQSERWTAEERQSVEAARGAMRQRLRTAWAVRLGRALADVAAVLEVGGLPEDVEDALLAALPALDYVHHRCTAGAPVRPGGARR